MLALFFLLCLLKFQIIAFAPNALHRSSSMSDVCLDLQKILLTPVEVGKKKGGKSKSSGKKKGK